MAASAILILAIALFVVAAVIAVAAVVVSVVTAVRARVVDSSKLFSIVIASPWTVVNYPPS